MTKIKNEYELLEFMKNNIKYGYVTYDGKNISQDVKIIMKYGLIKG